MGILNNTSFDDPRINTAIECIKKENGTNPGYHITHPTGTRFTVKQGSTVGNTLAEVFSSMALSKIIQAMHVEDKNQQLIANAFLVIKKHESTDTFSSIEERCKASLYAASQWSSDKTSFEVCQLFGLEKRITAAGTRQGEDFNDLRKLNEACDLGLEKIVLPTALIADFDLHTENIMLKINDTDVKDTYKENVAFHLKLLKQAMLKTDSVTRQDRLTYLIGIIHILKELGAHVFFHKIDHDSGFYRYAHPERKVNFLTHRTSPVHRVGSLFKTQPTLHITEITGGTKEGMDQLLLSDKAIENMLNIDLTKELEMIASVANDFFELVHEKSEKIAGCLTAEFYFLNEFYYHIKEERMPIPEKVSDSDIIQIKNAILLSLERGTKLKVNDLHEQLYKRLLERERDHSLTVKQNELKLFLEKQDYLKDLIPIEKENSFSFSIRL